MRATWSTPAGGGLQCEAAEGQGQRERAAEQQRTCARGANLLPGECGADRGEYLSQSIAKLPFDDRAGVVPNEAGRVLIDEDAHGAVRYLVGVYVTGWIKRGPVGLIGHTRGDANQTVACLLDDRESCPGAVDPTPESVIAFLTAKGIPFTTWPGWYRLDAHERARGVRAGRERVKVVERAEMLRVSLG